MSPHFLERAFHAESWIPELGCRVHVILGTYALHVSRTDRDGSTAQSTASPLRGGLSSFGGIIRDVVRPVGDF